MRCGKVKFWNEKKGFGFIVPDDGSADVFVHVNSLKAVGLDELLKGDTVDFTTKEGRNGKIEADHVTIVLHL